MFRAFGYFAHCFCCSVKPALTPEKPGRVSCWKTLSMLRLNSSSARMRSSDFARRRFSALWSFPCAFASWKREESSLLLDFTSSVLDGLTLPAPIESRRRCSRRARRRCCPR